jgi:hypothetical protein
MARVAQETQFPACLHFWREIDRRKDIVSKGPLFRYNIRCFIILLLKMQVGNGKGYFEVEPPKYLLFYKRLKTICFSLVYMIA